MSSPAAYYGPPPPGAPNAYAGHPAYAAKPSSAPRSTGLNAWVAALLGVLVGMLLTAAFGAFLWFATGGPMPWESAEELAEDWTGSVQASSEGSVPGPSLADAVLDVGGGGYYEEVVCPATPRVAADVTTLCRVDDGYDKYRVVVLFLDDNGRFETAEMFGD